MSRADVRVVLAEAVSVVTGVTGHPRRPAAPAVGDAWPLWRGLDRGQGFFVDTWAVMVALPGDEANADQWVDAHDAELEAALAPHMYVTGIAPVAMASEAGESFGLMITGSREV
jgi:hypothetical protein